MWRVLRGGLRAHRSRLVAPGVAALVAVAFVTATIVMANTVGASALAVFAGDVGRYAAVAQSGDQGEPTEADLTALRAVPGVARADGIRRSVGRVSAGGPTTMGALHSTPTAADRLTLTVGRWPTGLGEVTVSTSLAAVLHVGQGEVIRWVDKNTTATVVGVVDTGRDPAYLGLPALFASVEGVTALTDESSYAQLRALAQAGTDPETLAAAVQARLPHLSVATGPAVARRQVERITRDAASLAAVLAGFGAVALLVAGLVIANTFAVLAARRRRETALLRCVGATRGQVWRLALAEAGLVGLVGSAGGVAVGIGAAALLARAIDRLGTGFPMDVLGVDALALAVPLVAGVVVTVLAVAAPLGRATRVRPVEALQPIPPATTGIRVGGRRLILASLAMALGVGCLALAVRSASLPLGVLGGAVSVLGVLLAGPWLVSGVLWLIGAAVAGVTGLTGRLAVDNARRHPRRAATTASALLVGVGLIAMMSVGAATVARSIDAAMDRAYAVDLAVSSRQGISPATIAGLSRVEGVSGTATLPGAQVTIGGVTVDAYGVGPQAMALLRDRAALGALGPGVVRLSPPVAHEAHVIEGDAVEVSVSGARRTLRAQVSGELGYSALLAEGDLLALAPAAPVTSVWLRIADTAAIGPVVEEVRAQVAALPQSQVGGAAERRALMQQILDVMLAVVTGLLAVSVVIALVGVGSTISLGVLERTRESALLRALGLTRGRLRLMVALEAGLLSATGTALGAGLGVGYGWAAARCLLGPSVPVMLDVPWGRLTIVSGVAVGCGLLASVLPARAAARVAPAAALAVD